VKVLTAKEPAFGGKLDPEKLESTLNSYAEQGWSVAGCDSAQFPGFLGGARSELITVLHRISGPMKKYKILTQKDRFFGEKFDSEKLEDAINSYVPEGWQVCAVTSATFPGSGSSREEMVVILEKEALNRRAKDLKNPPDPLPSRSFSDKYPEQYLCRNIAVLRAPAPSQPSATF
jgi:hypothetical protein